MKPRYLFRAGCAAAVCALSALSGMFAPPAQATFPGDQNGKVLVRVFKNQDNPRLQGELWTLDIKQHKDVLRGVNQAQITNPFDENISLGHWSPDGAVIAFTSVVQGKEGIQEVYPDKSRRAGHLDGTEPTWNKDGQLSFIRPRKLSASIVVRNEEGKVVEVVRGRALSPKHRQPAWTVGDTPSVAYMQKTPQKNIFVKTSAGTVTQVTHAQALTAYEFPSWSPDGRFLAFTGYTHGVTKRLARADSIYVADLADIRHPVIKNISALIRHHLPLGGEEGEVIEEATGLQFSPDGNLMIFAVKTNQVRMWRVAVLNQSTGAVYLVHTPFTDQGENVVPSDWQPIKNQPAGSRAVPGIQSGVAPVLQDPSLGDSKASSASPQASRVGTPGETSDFTSASGGVPGSKVTASTAPGGTAPGGSTSTSASPGTPAQTAATKPIARISVVTLTPTRLFVGQRAFIKFKTTSAKVEILFKRKGTSKVLGKQLVTGKASGNKVLFKGLVRPGGKGKAQRLTPGAYDVQVLARGANGQIAASRPVSFVIKKKAVTAKGKRAAKRRFKGARKVRSGR